MYFLINDDNKVLSEIKYTNGKKEYKLMNLCDCFYKGSTSSRKYEDVISVLPKRYLFKENNHLNKISVKEFKNRFNKEINIIEDYRLR